MTMFGYEIIVKPGKGRCMFATKNFTKGESIFEEEPFISAQLSWNAAYGYAACDHCLRPLETVTENVRRLANNSALVVPYLQYDPTAEWQKQFTKCNKCQVRYCSEDCRREALNSYHAAACMGAARQDDGHVVNKLNEIWKKMHYPPETATIMLLVRLMAKYFQSNNKQEFIQTLDSFQSSAVNEEQMIHHKMLGENFSHQLEQLYEAFCAAFPGAEFAVFTTPLAFRSLMALMGTNCQGIATSPLAEWAKKALESDLPEAEKTQLDEYVDLIYNQVGEVAGEFLNNEGTGLYLLQSKINHSCRPNAEATFPYSNDICVIKAIGDIQASQEICISYIDDCQLERSRHSRQKVLRDNYLFQCDCPKCNEESNQPDETSDEEEDEDMEEDEGMSD